MNPSRKKSCKVSRRPIVLALIAVCGGPVLAGHLYAAGQPPPQPSAVPGGRPAAPAAQAAEFAGDDTCAVCHEAQVKGITATLHGKAANERTPAATGHTCETCHGAGK